MSGYTFTTVNLKDVGRDSCTFTFTILTFVSLCGRFSNPVPSQYDTNYRPANLFGPSIPSHLGITLRHRININIFQTIWEMWAARNTSGALALLLSLDSKFVNNFQKKNPVL
jgi:hypothetical protein